MALSILSIQPFWATKTALTTLVPAANVWIDIAANGTTMPYVTISQIAQPTQWLTGGNYITRLRFQFSVWASTLAQVSTIATAIQTAFKWSKPSGNSWGCRLDNVIPRAQVGGAYNCILEYTMFETLT